MMRSLWSGVSGLQAHQIAMDVEGNNIANVNTYGFKYNRANFADILSQTPRVATAPQGQLGGQNAMQIGLGTTINSTTRIFSQGTLTATDKQTDLALQGNGFFVVSPDGGTTRYYTRNGDFVRDKAGNFVNNSGYIVQGWTRDDETGTIDSTGPISNIVIKEGLTTPARATTEVKIKGNLDSGNSIGQRSTPIYALDSVAGGIDYDNDGKVGPNEAHNENDVNNDKFYTNSRNEQILTERGVDLGVTFDELGNGLALRDKQGIWVSYANAKTHKFIIGSGDPHDVGSLRGDQTLNITLNGEKIGPKTVNSISDIAAAINAQYNKTGVSAEISEGNKLTLINRNNSGTTKETKNIHLTVNGGDTLVAAMTALGEPNGGLRNQEIITAYQYVYTSSQTTAIHQNTDAMPRQVTTTEDLRAAMQKDAREYVDYNGDGNGTIPADTGAVAEIKRVKALGLTTSAAVSGAINPPYKAKYDAAVAALPTTTSEDDKIKAGLKAAAGNLNDGVKITVNKSGQFQLENPADDVADQALYMTVTGLTEPAKDASTAAVNENVRLTTMMKALDGALSPGQAQRASGKMMMSSHGSTAEIFDSLGSKHTVSIKWAKTGTTKDGGTEWNMIIQVPEPAKINYSGEGPDNVVTGSVRFNSNGSLASFHPSTITFSANNGSQGGQSVNLNFGLGTDFNGLTSFDKDSSTDSISQDGYTGGTLNDLKIDETGTIIGAFTNGQSFGLAQVALASFTNNEGLQSEGGNVFSQTANSGEAVIGAAGTGDKGTIAASKLEASNVDLSRALTDLIVIQRGFQANSKTITTSDEMLNTLLQLKQ
ncbi:flagellar hook protein FlgE [Campylobacter concisus]|uniref:Flagellar hook protein FlgE n=1 Tax=Campylobacter concisus TaxID=199 RepID=A0A1Y5NJE0_9BACT|nr:flagellar hook protein FlgE [Campylobacter concisus]OUT18125.1 flagellar hook protein FlgE [Campylobacter concisus]